jgi:hypothetical protein
LHGCCCRAGARRLLHWEQRLILHASSGQTVLPAELKVKLSVSAAELRDETGLGEQALKIQSCATRHLIART